MRYRSIQDDIAFHIDRMAEITEQLRGMKKYCKIP